MVPAALIILPFLVAFMVATWQYTQIDPRRRVLNLRFLLMAGAVTASFGYPIFIYKNPDSWRMSWIVFILAIFWLGWSFYLLRRMPPRQTH
jgi:hypothetical protein